MSPLIRTLEITDFNTATELGNVFFKENKVGETLKVQNLYFNFCSY